MEKKRVSARAGRAGEMAVFSTACKPIRNETPSLPLLHLIHIASS
jgi:hypothetical protein